MFRQAALIREDTSAGGLPGHKIGTDAQVNIEIEQYLKYP
jgi:hypothetical protein